MFSKILCSLDKIANGVENINKNLNKHFVINDLNFLIPYNQFIKIYVMSSISGIYEDICVWSGKFGRIPFEYLKEEIYKISTHKDGSMVFVLNIDYDKKIMN